HLGNLFLIVQLHFSKLFLILKSGVNHTSRGSISTSTLPSIKLRKCSSKIITSILSFISGRLATKSNQIKQLIRNGRSASLQHNHEYPFLYQRQTCHQVQPNQPTYQKRQKCQPATYLQEVLYQLRSEERRVGKECRSRWSSYP